MNNTSRHSTQSTCASMCLPSMDGKGKLHIVMFPWLAMGHLIPFLELSKCLVHKGHKISFISTPRNIKRLPKIPMNLSPLINLVGLPLPHVENLPENAEATIDLPANKVYYLKKAFDGLEGSFGGLLEDLLPDWIIYDFAPYWLPPIADKLGIPCAFFTLFSASSNAFFGPPFALSESNIDALNILEDLSIVPKWMPVGSNVVLRRHELLRMVKSMGENVSNVEDGYRSGSAIQGSKVVFIRSCTEFEKDWLHFLEKEIHQKPVIPIGLLPPSRQENIVEDEVEKWMEMRAWLEKQRGGSVVYVALGTEATLSQEEVLELALGLELSNLPFFWVLRKPSGSAEDYLLPIEFEDRINDRGFICRGWAPQVRILEHRSVGGFLTHCGWNSIIESLGVGCALILLPLVTDQGLNARVLAGRSIGLEIPRDRQDGSFTRESVAEALRMVMTDEKGEIFRNQAREMEEIFGNRELQDRYVDDFIKYLQEHVRNEIPQKLQGI